MVFKVIKNILSGMGGVALMLALISGVGMAAGLPQRILLLPIIITTLIHIILNPKSMVVVSLPASLITIIFQITLSPALYNPFITFLIPAVFFIGLSFIKNLQWFIDRIPTNLVSGVLLALGFIFIVKNIARAASLENFTQESFEVDFYWPGLMIALLIPSITFLLNYKWKKFPWLWAVATFFGTIAAFLPYQRPQAPIWVMRPMIDFTASPGFDFEIVKESMKMGFFILLVLLADFFVFNAVIDRFKYSDQNKPNRTMLALGIGNFIGTFIGGVPSSISTTNSVHLGENKATNAISLGVMVFFMLVLVFVPLPIPLAQGYIIAGIMFYLGLRFIIKGIQILKGSKIFEIIASLLTMLTIILLDLQKGFIVGAVLGIIYYLISKKKKEESLPTSEK